MNIISETFLRGRWQSPEDSSFDFDTVIIGLEEDFAVKDGVISRGYFGEDLEYFFEDIPMDESVMQSFYEKFGVKFKNIEEFLNFTEKEHSFNVGVLKEPTDHFVTVYYSFNGVPFHESLVNI